LRTRTTEQPRDWGCLIAHDQEVHVLGESLGRAQAQNDVGSDGADLPPIGEGETSQQPENGLLERVGFHEEQKGGHGRGHGAGRDPRQEEGFHPVEVLPPGKNVDKGNETEPGGEGEDALAGEPEDGDVDAEIDADDGPERGAEEAPTTKGSAIGFWKYPWRMAREGKRRPDQEGQKNPGKPEVDEDRREGQAPTGEEVQKVCRCRPDGTREQGRQKAGCEEDGQDGQEKAAFRGDTHGFLSNLSGECSGRSPPGRRRAAGRNGWPRSRPGTDPSGPNSRDSSKPRVLEEPIPRFFELEDGPGQDDDDLRVVTDELFEAVMQPVPGDPARDVPSLRGGDEVIEVALRPQVQRPVP